MIVDFIHWSQGVFSRLRCGGGEIFSQHALQTGHKCTSFRVNHYLCPQRPLSPSSILPLLPPSFSHTVTSTLPSLPFFITCPFSFFLYPKFIIGKISHRPSCAQTYTCIPLQSCQLNSCFLIKSKQPLTELLPCYLTPATHLISLCSPDAQLTQACVILSVSRVHVCACIFF